jgi:hypothetical protein
MGRFNFGIGLILLALSMQSLFNNHYLSLDGVILLGFALLFFALSAYYEW